MLLSEILNPQCVKAPLAAANKREAIFELIDLLAEAGEIGDRAELKQAVWERETTRTTGIGHGIAIPHGKTAGCPKITMAIGKPAEPLEFGAIDHRPVNLIVLLASPLDQTGPHIQTLAAVSQMLVKDDVRAAFAAAASSEQLLTLVRQHQPK